MGSFAIVRYPTANTPIKADYGKAIADSIKALKPIPRDGQRISTTPYGTKIDYDPSTVSEMSLSDADPFQVAWRPYDPSDTSRGEWQIFLPRGCASVSEAGITSAYVPVNDDGKDGDGKTVWQWYKLPDPKDEDANVTTFNGYAAKEWTVYIHMKPWARMKATTKEKDDDFGIVQQSVAVATIALVEVSSSDGSYKMHESLRLKDNSSISVNRDDSRSFAIRYEINGNSKDASPKCKLCELSLSVGRRTLTADNVDITGWKEVWVKVLHDEETCYLSAVVEEESSNDDKTVFKIYELKDNVVVSDLRGSSPTLDFYTNAPQ